LKQAKWAPLLEKYPDLRRWYDNLARGSENTARERVRILYRFLIKFNYTPTSLVEEANRDQKKVENLLLDFTTELSREKMSPGYIENYLKAVRTWLSFNGVELKQRIKIGNRNEQPTIADERVPMKEELRQILLAADARGRTSIALMSMSGLRPQVLGDANGLDGLKLGDLPELEVKGGQVSFKSIPTMVVIRASLSKARHRYFSFLGEEGCGYLRNYLEKRVSSGEELDNGSPVIAFKSGYGDVGRRETARTGSHVTTKSLTQEIRSAMRPRFTWRPYVLRAYFDTQLMVAESNGKTSHSYRQFWMGHSGDIEARYTTNKGRLPPEVIEDMRAAYKRCEGYLETSKPSTPDEEKLRENFREQLLAVAGFKPEEVEGMDLSMEDTEFQELVRRRLLGSVPGRGQKVVSVGEVERYLSEGWGFVSTLPNRRAVLTPPDFGRKMNY
jgi:hypothetical protein